MTTRVRQLLTEITRLEGELRGALKEHEQSVHFEFKGRRVRFDQSVREAHLKLKQRMFGWLRNSSPGNILSAPLIYLMIVPFALLDLCITLFQLICFRLYRIPPVRRSDYMAFDRHHLGYLNVIERLNCIYCGYCNGLLAYVTEVAGRTEQYWCPIKHARKVLGSHARYARFIAYGDAADYHDRLAQFRAALMDRGPGDAPTEPPPSSDGVP